MENFLGFASLLLAYILSPVPGDSMLVGVDEVVDADRSDVREPINEADDLEGCDNEEHNLQSDR